MPDSLDSSEPEMGRTLTSAKLCFIRCHYDKRLLPIKVFYFSFMGALGVVFPYVSVFLKQVGLSATQIGLISGLRPAIGFFSGFIWGSVADQFRIRRALLIVSVLGCLFFFIGLYLIDTPPRLKACPVELTDSYKSSHSVHLKDSGGQSKVVAQDRKTYKENLQWLYEPEPLYGIFIICLIIICGGELFQSPTTALLDAATLEALGRDGLNQYGAQRAWGTAGGTLSSLLVGIMLNNRRYKETICGIDLSFSDYHVISYIFLVILVLSLVAVFQIDFDNSHKAEVNKKEEDEESPAYQHSTLAVFKFFLNFHYGSWIVTAFFSGVCSGAIWGFLYWHIDNLGGTHLLMGIDNTVGCTCEFIGFFTAEYVIGYVGHMGVMYIGLAAYAIRFIVYGSLVNPWYVIPASALQGLTYSFAWTSLTAYTAMAIPSASFATIQGIVHGVFYGLGVGLGHCIGGILIGTYGAVATYYGFSLAAWLWLIAFILCQKFSKKPVSHFIYQETI